MILGLVLISTKLQLKPTLVFLCTLSHVLLLTMVARTKVVPGLVKS